MASNDYLALGVPIDAFQAPTETPAERTIGQLTEGEFGYKLAYLLGCILDNHDLKKENQRKEEIFAPMSGRGGGSTDIGAILLE